MQRDRKYRATATFACQLQTIARELQTDAIVRPKGKVQSNVHVVAMLTFDAALFTCNDNGGDKLKHRRGCQAENA